MPVNNKLTHAIRDRVVQNFQLNALELLISFVDGSTMKITIAECNNPPLHEGARIRQISEDQAKLSFDVTGQDFWMAGYTKKVRNVSAEMKRQVYREHST